MSGAHDRHGAADGVSDEAGVDRVTIANEFATVDVRVVRTRNGVRLRIESPSRGDFVELCPVELDCLVALSPEARRQFVTDAIEQG